MNDERLPVLVGAAQWIQRNASLDDVLEPLSVLEGVARGAARDARADDKLLDAVDTVGLVPVAGWRPRNGPRALAERLGARARSFLETANGGEAAILLVNAAAERIAAGRSQVALLAGLNPMRTLRLAEREGRGLPWLARSGSGDEPDRIGTFRMGHDEREARYGLDQPISFYPLLETATRARRGRSPQTHLRALGELMAPFTRVAAGNPYAWFPVERSAEELVTVTPANRMIAHPYPKYLNAVLDTDQGAAVILCSAAAARARGIPEDRLLYWRGGAHTEERAWYVSQRAALGRSPALEECARRVLARARVEPGALDAIDFYSCFPVAVEMACEAYGVAEDDARGLTVTGGLPYHGGPGSNYAMHGVAAMAARLRDGDGSLGLTTGNGWYLTKHAGCVWSTRPPTQPVGAPVEAPVQVGPKPLDVRDDASGAANVDAYTVLYDREGALARGVVVGTSDAGERFLAQLPADPGVLDLFVSREKVGSRGRVHPDGDRLRFEPT